jgi:HK97 family phage major capsid protein
MPSAKLIEKRKELEAKQAKLHKVFEEMGSDHDMDKVKSLEGDAKAKTDAIKKMNDELAVLGAEVDSFVAIEDMAKSDTARQKAIENAERKGFPLPVQKGDEELKSIGQMFIESEAYTKRDSHGGPAVNLDVDLKTTMTTAAGFAPQSIRSGKVVEYAHRPIQVTDLIPSGTTDQAAIVYMEETTSTSNAAEATESSGAYGEAAFAFTERTATVRKIAVNIPVTQEQLEDVAGIQSFINTRLSFFLRQRFDYQIINGNNSAPNLGGILANTSVQSFALAGDKFDAIYDAAKRTRVTGRASPNALVMHPNDWQDIRLMRTSEGLYILGNPSEPGPGRIWGLQIVEGDVIPEGTSLVGDFANHIQYFEKRGIEVDITDSHASEFIYGILRIRASFRVALPIYRPSAFCYITGM